VKWEITQADSGVIAALPDPLETVPAILANCINRDFVAGIAHGKGASRAISRGALHCPVLLHGVPALVTRI